ncbi:MAG: S8 family serine peptidase [Steroidobacteraceae bacterium]
MHTQFFYRRVVVLLGSLVWLLVLPSMALAEYQSARSAPSSLGGLTDRVIIGFRAETTVELLSMNAEITALSSRVDLPLRSIDQLGDRLAVVQLSIPTTASNVEAALSILRADSQVAFAEPDRRRYAHAMPNDPLYVGQWYLKGEQASAVRADSAWDSSTGSAGVIVAVLDTGIRYDHPDLERAASGGRLLPGYDFVAADSDGKFTSANDGDGRDADASDPGDWVTTAEAALPIFDDNCEAQDESSWHGTRVAGLVGARSNNNAGIAGLTWRPWILPVRVLGKCGGYDSDILAGMRWAGGLAVTGVPANPYPARVINLSLGSDDRCPASYQTVIDELVRSGVVVVASAGNESGPVAAPASCQGVVSVVALRHAGTKVGFSSLGANATIGAPGGNCVNVGANEPCLYSIDTTTNLGATTPGTHGYTDQFNFNVGTSFSAPLVAGVAALMISTNATLTSSEITERLRVGARAYPAVSGIPICRNPSGPNDRQTSECACTSAACGAGMLDAVGALAEARRPLAVIAVPTSVTAGQSVTLQANGSTASCGRSLQSYSWVVLATGAGGALTSSGNTSSVTVLPPTSGTLQLQLTVTDNQGARDTALVNVTATAASSDSPQAITGAACPTELSFAPPVTTSPNPSTGSGAASSGGGGGSMDLWMLLMLSSALVWRAARRHGVFG